MYGTEIFRMIAIGKFHKICKFKGHVLKNDIIMMSLPKTMQNSGVQETSQIIYHSKDRDESYPKMQVLSNLSNFVKSYGHLKKFRVFTTSTHQIWLDHVTRGAKFGNL